MSEQAPNRTDARRSRVVSLLPQDMRGRATERVLNAVDSADLTFADLFAVRDVIASDRDHDGVIITTGTDSLEELAYGLDLVLDDPRPVVITGAVRPPHLVGYDGALNLFHSAKAIETLQSASLGVTCLFAGELHAARYIEKRHAQGLVAFTSYPGPLGVMRGDQLSLFARGLPFTHKYSSLASFNTSPKVDIWTMSFGSIPAAERFFGLDGLIVAGMGDGGLSAAALEALSPAVTSRLPVVLATRCGTGFRRVPEHSKFDRAYFTKYGFLLQGYEELTAVKARMKLTLALAPGQAPSSGQEASND